ncbi:MAG TPA: xylose isomerase [Hyphomicrobiales bacterium]|nr:xylose isomerase [Hyphomicrobiales bacterium]
MSTTAEPFFKSIDKIRYEGPDSTNPFAFHYYDAKREVMGKTLEEHLRFAVCYWHTFCWPGGDPFGGQTLMRPWLEAPASAADAMAHAEQKLRAAFEFFEKLGAPFYCFHDVDMAPEGQTLAESNKNLLHMAELAEAEMARTGVKLLWGTANLFSNRRFMGGAATNPDPEVFAYAAGQVKQVMEVTHRLGGVNYVLWGGREGYETLLNTDMRRELEQFGRFMNLVVEHKHKIGFKGTILIEPKPHEPTKHQYDFDCASVHAFLRKFGLENEIKLNIEANHATLAGHSFEHELAYATANDILGSIDINRGDPQLGWDTDQFPNSVPEVALAMYVIYKNGGFTTGGVNFDAKIRRQSIEPDDLFHAHIGGMDVCARGLIAAAKMIEDRALDSFVEDRYSGWSGQLGQEILSGAMTLEQISDHVVNNNITPQPKSGRQEMLENIVNRYV